MNKTAKKTKKEVKDVFAPSNTKIYVSAPLRVGRSKTGLGLFALEKIKRGDFVIEYTGEPIDNKEAIRRNNRYVFEVNRKWNIDGSTYKNKARYMNHSCRPNCEVEIKGGRILMFALKNIKIGEELTFDYGEDHFDEFIKPYGCKCPKH